MSILDRLTWKSSPTPARSDPVLDAIRDIAWQTQVDSRAYPVGQDIDASQVNWGIDNATFQPPEYASYLATSNAVYACVSVRARNLAGLPLRIYTVNAQGEKTDVTSGPIVKLLQKVNPYWTLSRLLDMTEQSLCLWGESYWFLTKKGRVPTELWWARADQVKVHPHPTEYISHFTYEPHTGARTIRFERDETVWFRYPNPIDQYIGLAPLAAARLAADSASASMHANFNIFRNGMGLSGIVTPDGNIPFSKEQAEAATESLKNLRGVDKRHMMAVMNFQAKWQPLALTPKDAQFLGLLKWSLEDIARAFHVPIDKIGGERTYQNVEESELVFWNDLMVPEARLIATEITEQLLPLFGDQYLAEFDLSGINALQEDETQKWTIWKEQIVAGVKTQNQYREEIGDDPVPWGDVWWMQSTLQPIDSPEKPAPVMPALGPDNEPDDEDDETTTTTPEPERSRHVRAKYAYGSLEHETHWRYIIEREQPWEGRIGRTCADLMQRQKASILADLTRASKREVNPDDPFDRPRWIKSFRQTMRPIIAGVVYEAAELARDELGLTFAFDTLDPNVIRAVEKQTQRFAEEVNATTWNMLKAELKAGIEAGEGSDKLAERVERVMADRIRSSKETIARTEAHLASTQGTHESWRQSGVVEQVEWLAALDERTRESHVAAHGQRVGLGDDFQVGACSGPGPGMTGCASEDINCRCVTIAILDVQGMLDQ